VLLLSPRTGRAQACCTATGSSGFGVVGRCYFAVLATQLSYERGYGTFDSRGRFSRLRNAEVDDFVVALGGGVRLGTPALQLHGSIPLRMQYRDLHGLPAASAVGFGDASLMLRAMAVEDRMTGLDVSRPASLLPFVEPFAGVRMPTGRAPRYSTEPTGVDAMGDGAWTAIGGVALTKFITLQTAATLTASYGRRFPHRVRRGTGSAVYSPGDEISARFGLVRVFDLFWSGSLFVSGIFTRPVAIDGHRIAASSTRRIRVGAGVQRYIVFPTWEVGVSASVDPPIDGFAQNIPFPGSTVSLLLQRNFTW
jgi:hypothetical protein